MGRFLWAILEPFCVNEHWVLGWQIDQREITLYLDLDFWWDPVRPVDWTSSKRASLVFREVQGYDGLPLSCHPSYGPDGEVDYGSILSMARTHDGFAILGEDFDEVHIRARSCFLIIEGRQPVDMSDLWPSDPTPRLKEDSPGALDGIRRLFKIRF